MYGLPRQPRPYIMVEDENGQVICVDPTEIEIIRHPDEIIRSKIIKALEMGNVKWSEAGHRYFDRAGVIALDHPDFTLVEAEAEFWGPWSKGDRGNKGGMEIHWSTVSAGFGSLTINLSNEGHLEIESEGMSREFCKKVFAKLIDSLPDDHFKR